ncbi:MAG TPA: winged helix-turn-helix domain-containing protein [Armatimonadota bacterium]|nr:winged helix-turn-helix domain-containing protein [Armatimonadota bacterium]
MRKKATIGSNLASSKKWDSATLDAGQIDRLVESIRAAGHSMDSQALAQALDESLDNEAPTGRPASSSNSASRVKKYDHRCDYQEGEQVYVDNRYGKSLATITRIIRQPATAFCDKAFLEFEDDEYRTRWEEERSTPYFAINSGRVDAPAVYVDATSIMQRSPAKRPRLNATATAKLARIIDRALASDSRVAREGHGWRLASAAPSTTPRPHISAEPGGAGIPDPLSQGCYKAPVLEIIDKMGEATIEDIKENIQSRLRLSPADWETDKTGKIVWIHRLHAAIKHLKRVGSIDSPRREVYRRVRVQREKSA